MPSLLTSVRARLAAIRSSRDTLPYLPGLDNLRALGALGVCTYHFVAGTLPEREQVIFIRELFSQVYLGIYIFFVISGYVLPYSLLRQDYQPGRLWPFLTRRFVRINPPAYLVMLLALGQWYFIDNFVNHNHAYTSKVSAGQLLHNFLLTTSFTDYKWLVGACWTLAVEWQFYVLTGLLFPLLFRHRWAAWWFIGVNLILSSLHFLLVPTTITHLTYLTDAPLFALGGVTLLWQQQRLSGLAYAGCLALFATLTAYQIDVLTAQTAVLTALAIVLLNKPIPGLTAIGKISYSLYLTHMLVGPMAEFLLVKFITPDSDLHRALIVALCFVAALSVAALFYRWVERPFYKWATQIT
jgi:peptidoglycan/LPS O-acetylase OafA/YrhL